MITALFPRRSLMVLLTATAISAVGQGVWAQQSCAVGTVPVPDNCAPKAPALPGTGFSITLNGAPVAGDARVVEVARKVDIVLAKADIRVTFDGLGAQPRLDLEQVPGSAPDSYLLGSALNYPAYVTRAEMRIVQLDALGGPRLIDSLPVTPNGQVSYTAPDAGEYAVVHRVYDAQGRFDETQPQPLGTDLPAGSAADIEEGRDTIARRAIPVFGGAVTVSGANVMPGSRVQVLGQTVRPDASGRFVVQRILPQGGYDIDVTVTGPFQATELVRDIDIPAADWFAVGTADVTLGLRTDGRDGSSDSYAVGRLAGFINGRTASGYEITASVDTGEGPLEDLLRDLDEKDPRQLLLRIDPDDYYPTFGDDAEILDLTPTSGKIYARIARENNFAQFGDFVSEMGDNAFVRNDRTLYGAQAHVETRVQTAFGTPVGRATVHAAQPDSIPVREALNGTGGSVYFLANQDVLRGTEQLFVQVRDPQSDRVIESRALTPGVDYDINYIQGLVTLSEPLLSSTGDGIGGTTGPRRNRVLLVAQYEYVPVLGDIDGFASGVRVERWVAPGLRVGLSGTRDDTGIRDHTLVGGDLLFALTERSYLRLDAARSEGQGIDTLLSFDGGLSTNTQDAASGQGTSVRVEGSADLTDLGLSREGKINAYVEQREEGFSSLDTQVTALNGDEDLFGLSADVQLTDATALRLSYDSYKSAAGDSDKEGVAAVTTALNDRLSYTLGAERIDRDALGEQGSRIDVAARLTYAFDNARSAYVFGQTTVDRDGLEDNDRVGLGVELGTGTGWGFEGELSDGSLGAGARAYAVYTDAAGDTQYIGYTLEPGRELNGLDLTGDDKGRFVVGGRRTLSQTVSVFGENTYDMFGERTSLISAYGVTYAPIEKFSTTLAFETGEIDVEGLETLDRYAVSLGVSYATDAVSAKGRLEYRSEEGSEAGSLRDTDTVVATADLAYKIDETQRVLFSADTVQSSGSETGFRNGDYADVSIGYALRPIEDDRFNMLARYRYLDDQIGQRVDGLDMLGPVQRSHVGSVDASYDVNQYWTLSGKLGYRGGEFAPVQGGTFTRNDAMLTVIGARYHLVDDWDLLAEARRLDLITADVTRGGVLIAAFKQLGKNLQVGGGYNFSRFSDDLTDLTYDDRGVFVNIVGKY
ncbi:hypothetical protein LGQ03_16510 [Loktanella sp. TSTF-M6]|uniref:Uncharacterized protein n=1 Tax=Loktanella gaetbuli TaxID=2881335 RepID=A0ABS8BZF4_9RHOB|nr:hypothetical protein [Loktanella gaetbuli]MCB5200841.1 hypothetical protein [Loktanella gaetbuli]